MTSKLFLTLMLTVFAAASAFGQDLIVKRNAEEIEAKVMEINDTNIKYHRADNPGGPLYNVAKSEVFMIKYENGSKDVFAEEAPKTAPVAASSAPAAAGIGTASTVASEQLVRLGSNIFALGGGQAFSFQEANRFINDPDIVARLKNGVVMKQAAVGLGVGGAIMVIAGIGMAVGAVSEAAYYGDYVTGYGMAAGAVTMWVVGSASVVTAIVLGSVSPGVVRRAVNDYNRNARAGLYSGLKFGIATTPGGLGLQMTF